MHYRLADPALAHRSPGEEFARVVATGDRAGDVDVDLAVSLPTTFPLAQHRPRYTVRHLLKSAVVTAEPVRYVSEAYQPPAGERAGTTYARTPEAAFRPVLAEARLTPLTATVPVPKGLTDDPALLAAFVDHRVVVRLCTVENEALLRGTADGALPGLLNLTGRRRRPAGGPLEQALTRAAADVEEMGGSCDGIVAHPELYWRLVASGGLGRLAEAGIRVARTRMIEPGLALLGDFRAAVTLLEPGTSRLSLRRDEAHAGRDKDDAGRDEADAGSVVASIRVGVAVHLPQHFLLLELG